jgi:hypothetical protein
MTGTMNGVGRFRYYAVPDYCVPCSGSMDSVLGRGPRRSGCQHGTFPRSHHWCRPGGPDDPISDQPRQATQ